MIHAQSILEFNQILQMLEDLAICSQAKQKSRELSPFFQEAECLRRMEETTGARTILDICGTPPLPAMERIPEYLTLCSAGSMLTPSQLASISRFISSCKQAKAYLKKAESTGQQIATYGESIYDLSLLQEEIEQSIRNEQVDSSASPLLRDLRRKMENIKMQIQNRLSSLLRSKKAYFSDSSVVVRGGRYALPVKKEYKSQFPGKVLDISGSGNTFFMEPDSIGKMQSELSLLQIEEDNEIRRILYTLSGLVDSFQAEFKQNMEAFATLDFLFAKGKLSQQMNANAVTITTQRKLLIHQGRHPLLDQTVCVPLDFQLNPDCTGVIITGPNTGGKTVALKTVGLLSMMAQSGLHVPALPDSVFCMNSSYLCDIGDGQSISENLSTFSAHMTQVVKILKEADRESLVLLDELGSGTDPAEGMGIAVAILEELRKSGCFLLATTHYPEVKSYAEEAPRFLNARMTFDRETLKPTYHLELGKAGESCALFIAKRLGFPPHLLELAKQAAYGSRQEETDGTHASPIQPQNYEVTQTPSKLISQKPESTSHAPRRCDQFQIGDSVTVYPKREIGIVYQTVDSRGNIGVQIKGKKLLIPHRRLKRKVAASELYPPDYDFSIIFDSVENRKARKQMNKRHCPDLEIKHGSPDSSSSKEN
ncbi:MAG: endonuclease MutS2 [Massiliimalia sp.]